MNLLQSLLFTLISFGASVIGAICGIGGGVIIKPALDLLGWENVETISFLSSCTVLSMSCYSVGRSMLAKEKTVDVQQATPLAIGGAIGGIIGNQLFSIVKEAFHGSNTVGAVQAICLLAVTVGTLLCTLNKCHIQTHRIKSKTVSLLIGLALGILSSFLGIGGGPINLVVLFFFFSMDTKTAAANSLYIILFSQVTNLLVMLLTGSVPPITPETLVFMVLGGICGGTLGRIINRIIAAAAVDKLFVGLMVLIILICLYNAAQYSGILG